MLISPIIKTTAIMNKWHAHKSNNKSHHDNKYSKKFKNDKPTFKKKGNRFICDDKPSIMRPHANKDITTEENAPMPTWLTVFAKILMDNGTVLMCQLQRNWNMLTWIKFYKCKLNKWCFLMKSRAKKVPAWY